MQHYIEEVINGVSNTYGKNFFESICLELDKIIRADFTFIAVLDEQAYTSTTKTLIAKGKIADNISYSLEHTPCANVADDSICCYDKGVCEAYPDDQLLRDMGIEAYLGTPLHDSKGKVMGIIVAMYEHPIEDPEFITTLFQLFSGRIAAELEREQYEISLEKVNAVLRQDVEHRTEALSQAIENLKLTQNQLIESEKIASLGNLVAGVAHEINTPLGIAITGQGFIKNELEKINHDGKELIKIPTRLYEQLLSSANLVDKNLQRAASTVNNFKKIAVDQQQLKIEKLDLPKLYRTMFKTLKPLLEQKNVQVLLSGEESVLVNTDPTVHNQILTHLVTNSIEHGFLKTHDSNIVSVRITQLNSGKVSVSYRDNGIGVDNETQQQIFEPFYTKNRGKKSGLGMAIVYNLVTRKLNGSIKLQNQLKGCEFIIEFQA